MKFASLVAIAFTLTLITTGCGRAETEVITPEPTVQDMVQSEADKVASENEQREQMEN